MGVFGWAVKSTRSGSDQSGTFSKVAVEIASFPPTVKLVMKEVSSISSGDYKDEVIRVRREENADYSALVPVPMTLGIKAQGLLIYADKARTTLR